jgi:hypothetical protein
MEGTINQSLTTNYNWTEVYPKEPTDKQMRRKNYKPKPNMIILKHFPNYYNTNDLIESKVSGDHQTSLSRGHETVKYYVEQCGDFYIVSKIKYVKERIVVKNNKNMKRTRFYFYDIKIRPTTDINIITKTLKTISNRRHQRHIYITEEMYNNIKCNIKRNSRISSSMASSKCNII